MKIDIDQIKVLLDMVGEADIAELTIEVEEERITIKKSTAGVPLIAPPAQHTELAVPAAAAGHAHNASHPPASGNKGTEGNNHSESEDHLVAVLAPMVGTFYRSSSPTAKPYLEVGDKVTVGQTVCIIEAMKLMNDLPSEVAGRVVKVCAENGSTVEFGQKLFLVDPKA